MKKFIRINSIEKSHIRGDVKSQADLSLESISRLKGSAYINTIEESFVKGSVNQGMKENEPNDHQSNYSTVNNSLSKIPILNAALQIIKLFFPKFF